MFVDRALVRSVSWSLLALAGLAGGMWSHARPQERAIPLDQAIENEDPSFFVHAEVDRASRQYQEGDYLTVRVKTESDAHVHILYQQADGKTYQIFPNKAQPNNFVKGGQMIEFPSRNDRFRWRVTAPFGKEIVKVLASKEGVKSLSAPRMRSETFNNVSTAELLAAAGELEDQQQAKWTEVALDIETFPRDTRPGAPGNRRFGVFFGVSKFVYNDICHTATNGEWSPNLHGAENDPPLLYKALNEAGKLTEGRVFLNEEVTLQSFKDAVTKWLPSVSRPGDTVFIAFSSHGGTIADDDGDEADGLDETLCTHEYIPAVALAHMIEHPETIPEHDRERVTDLIRRCRNARSNDEAIAILGRATCVTDDVFGHWLQKLAGRQVIVILDTCHSGGFATQEKGITPSVMARQFDFVDGEVARLKDIGQSDQVVFSACKAWQSSVDRGDNGLLTLALIESIYKLNGPVLVEQAFEYCQARIPEMLDEINTRRTTENQPPFEAQNPHMKNYCTLPVVFKP